MKIATLFSGIGAPEKAFRMLGIDYDLAYFGEINTHAVKSYCAIHNESESKNIGDITKVDIDKLPKDLDWLIGGSPCQDFSLAGKRAGGNIDSGTRSSLMWNFVEIIRETQPKQVLWENVQGALTADNKANYDKFINVLVAEGYKISAFTMNSKLYAIPQNRARIFVLASKSHTIRKPQGYDCGIRLSEIVEMKKEYKVNMEKLSITQQKCIKEVASLIHKDVAKTVRTGGRFSYDKHTWDIYGIRLEQSPGFTKIIKGNAKTLCSEKADGRYAVSNDNQIDYYYYSALECFRLMGFSDIDYQKCVDVGINNSQLYKQAGNSIVVQVLMAIFGEYYGIDWKPLVYGKWHKTGQEQFADLPIMEGV